MPKGLGAGSKATQFKKLEAPLRARFEQSYLPEPNSGCWLWDADTDNKGYGRIRDDGKVRLAHRVSLFLNVGKFPTKFVLHRCDTPCCVNPEHLYEGTQLDNMRDRSTRGRMADQRGERSHRAKLTTE